MAEKLFYSMGEVAEMFDVNPSLIRHWESQFSVLRPKRNKKGNRLFSQQDVDNLKLIYHLVKENGMTLEGARKALRSRRTAGRQMSREAELAERLLRIRALLLEVREDLKVGEEAILPGAEDGEYADFGEIRPALHAADPFADPQVPDAESAAGAGIGPERIGPVSDAAVQPGPDGAGNVLPASDCGPLGADALGAGAESSVPCPDGPVTSDGSGMSDAAGPDAGASFGDDGLGKECATAEPVGETVSGPENSGPGSSGPDSEEGELSVRLSADSAEPEPADCTDRSPDPDAVPGSAAEPSETPAARERVSEPEIIEIDCDAESLREPAPRRKRKPAVRIVGEPGAEDAAGGDAESVPVVTKRTARRPRRKTEEAENKELFAFFEQSLF